MGVGHSASWELFAQKTLKNINDEKLTTDQSNRSNGDEFQEVRKVHTCSTEKINAHAQVWRQREE